jgi:hypothetical protein
VSRCVSLFVFIAKKSCSLNLRPVIERVLGIGKHVPYAINMNREEDEVEEGG